MLFPLYHDFSKVSSNRTCLILWYFQTWGIYISIIVGEVLLIIRTYAIWGNSKKVAFGLGGLLFVAAIPAAYGAAELLLGLKFVPSPKSVHLGCLVTSFGLQGVIPYLVLLFFETVLLFVTLTKASRRRGGGRHALYKAIYRDGLLYYIWLLVFSVGNIAAIILLPRANAAHLAGLHVVIHSLLTSRLILNIRRAVAAGDNSDSSITVNAPEEQHIYTARARSYSESRIEGLRSHTSQPGLDTISSIQDISRSID